jgi:hypothetical protein
MYFFNIAGVQYKTCSSAHASEIEVEANKVKTDG